MRLFRFFFPIRLIIFAFFLVFSLSPLKTGDMKPKDTSILARLLLTSLYPKEPVLMDMEITAYCTGPCCNSMKTTNNVGVTSIIDWSNRIAAGPVRFDELHKEGIEVAAVDTDVIPFGSIIRYNDTLYAALDRGGLIKGERIDIAMLSHQGANIFGRKKNQTIEIYIPSDSTLATQILASKSLAKSSRKTDIRSDINFVD
jgi:3D (Asp-Asp-Asp) domain-containing protein